MQRKPLILPGKMLAAALAFDRAINALDTEVDKANKGSSTPESQYANSDRDQSTKPTEA